MPGSFSTAVIVWKGLMSSTSDAGRAVPRTRKLLWLIWIAVLAVLVAGAAVLDYALGVRTAVVDADTITPQRGFALPTWQEGGYDATNLEHSLREIADVGATWVQFTPTWYQQARASSEIVRTPRTVTDAGLERAITLAHQRGLKVFLKPHLNLPNPGQDSSNNIRPDDRVAWFASYTAFITHYASMAQRLGAEQFAIATELSSTTNDRDAWLQVIQAVRDRYDGTVVYAASRDWLQVPFWDAVDLIGVDAYPPLSDVSTTDVSVLQRAWESYLDEAAALSARYGRKILFTEAGFTSQHGTTTDPSNWRISMTPNQAEQAAGYQALLATFSDEPWWAGVYWWAWAIPPYSEAEPLDFSPRGKAAEAVIRRWWVA
jgi:hypothetical protein